MQRNLRKYARDEFLWVGEGVLNRVQSRAPVRTGRFIRSIEMEGYMIGGTELDIRIYSDLPYANAMEKGFTTRSGKFIESSEKTGWRAHFIRDSMLDAKRQFIDAVDRACYRALLAGGAERDE
jgi:hypothetical protein